MKGVANKEKQLMSLNKEYTLLAFYNSSPESDHSIISCHVTMGLAFIPQWVEYESW